MEISGIGSSAYADYLQEQNISETKLKDQINNTDYATATEDELLDACKQFEAYFLEQVFKEMQKTVDCVKDESSGTDNNLVILRMRRSKSLQRHLPRRRAWDLRRLCMSR